MKPISIHWKIFPFEYTRAGSVSIFSILVKLVIIAKAGNSWGIMLLGLPVIKCQPFPMHEYI